MNRVYSFLAALAFATSSGAVLAQDRDARSEEQLIVEHVDDTASNTARDADDLAGPDADRRRDEDRDVRDEPDVYIDSRGRHRHPHHGSPAPLFGALVGGLIGNQFGRGDGRAAATIAGAALGYAAGEASDRYDGYDDYNGSYGYDDGPYDGYYAPYYDSYAPYYGYPSAGYSIGFGYVGGGHHHRHYGGHGYHGGHRHGR